MDILFVHYSYVFNWRIIFVIDSLLINRVILRWKDDHTWDMVHIAIYNGSIIMTISLCNAQYNLPLLAQSIWIVYHNVWYDICLKLWTNYSKYAYMVVRIMNKKWLRIFRIISMMIYIYLDWYDVQTIQLLYWFRDCAYTTWLITQF